MIVASCVNKLVEGKGPAEQLPVSLAIDHARRSIDARKALLGAGNTQKAAAPEHEV
ncbi:MAG TPA: hypothetical protein VKE72_10710 [Methylocella sp.]|nr:hypothetical protein [Methylocella sp.]